MGEREREKGGRVKRHIKRKREGKERKRERK